MAHLPEAVVEIEAGIAKIKFAKFAGIWASFREEPNRSLRT